MTMLKRSSSAIKQWEEAGASLMTALEGYTKLCLNLGTQSLSEGVNSADLVSRIESALAGVHSTMSHHFDESRSALARTRNQLVSPIFPFPEEILSNIFLEVVYDYSNSGGPEPIRMQQEVSLIYHRLYTLLSVCSRWRDIVRNRGSLWAVIPVMTGPFSDKWRPYELSLQRAGGNPLHLAVATDSTPLSINLSDFLVEHGPRFRTVNITTRSLTELMDSIGGLLQHDALGSLSELSIQYIPMRSWEGRLPQTVIPRDSPQQASFDGLVCGLRAFRISGARFHWDAMTFSTRLVELRIQQVALGYDDMIVLFMQSLYSAPNLRDLKIIAVTTFRDHNSSLDPLSLLCATATLPALQSLLIQDLYLNTLKYLLPMAASGPHLLSLCLTHRSMETNAPMGANVASNLDFDDLCRAIRCASIDTLMIDGRSEDEWLPMSKIRRLTEAMPTLKTLKFHKWAFGRALCKNLKRVDTQIPPGGPLLQNLQLTSARIHSKHEFLDMVSSHSLQQVILGGSCQDTHPDGGHRWESFQEDNAFIQELGKKVSNLRLVEDGYTPPEFDSFVWKLW